MNYGTEHFYELLKQDLVAWVWNNPRLLHRNKELKPLTEKEQDWHYSFGRK